MSTETTEELLQTLEGGSTEQAQQAIDDFADAMSGVNLDEVVTESVTVAIREYSVKEHTDEHGKGRTQRKAVIRHVDLDVYVPTAVFNKMLFSRNKLLRKLKQEHADKEDIQTALVAWMSEPVLWVWQLTEEDMTLEQLEEGLDAQKIQKLFTLFFGNRLRQQTSKA